MPVQDIFVLPWLLWSAQYKICFSSPYNISDKKKGQKDKDIEGYQVHQVTEKDRIELYLDRIG